MQADIYTAKKLPPEQAAAFLYLYYALCFDSIFSAIIMSLTFISLV